MDDNERKKLAAELLYKLGDEQKITKTADTIQTENTVREVIEKTEVTETEYVARRKDMVEISDFFCRDSRRYDSGFEIY